MADVGNIVVTDQSALNVMLHCDFMARKQYRDVAVNPLEDCARVQCDLRGFNHDNPLYGGHPVKLLVPDAASRRDDDIIECRYSKCAFPHGSFIEMNDGVFITSPELTFARLANYLSVVQLAEVGTALCGRYYIDLDDEQHDRLRYLTSVAKIRKYLASVPDLRGRAKAERALRYVMDNSGSPMEGKSMLQLCLPKRMGGFGLPFNHMNYDVRAGRNAALTEQNKYCIDLVSTKCRVAGEFDGGDSHQDPAKDKRRRNALSALGWTVLAFEKDVIQSPAATEKLALQLAKSMGYRIQRQPSWDDAFINLRHELDLRA